MESNAVVATTNKSKGHGLDNNVEVESKPPKLQELFPLESVQLGWRNKSDWSVGAGMYNMGNTCYLNAALQALFHIPALVNWLISEEENAHACDCPSSGEKQYFSFYLFICFYEVCSDSSRNRFKNHQKHPTPKLILIHSNARWLETQSRYLLDLYSDACFGRFSNRFRLLLELTTAYFSDFIHEYFHVIGMNNGQ